MSAQQEIVICGLDGVLALIEHRLHHLYNDEGEKRWDRFLDACDDDMPNLPLIDRLNQARDEGVPVVIISGRSSSVKEKTEQWLARWHIGYDALWLRPARDFSKAAELKASIIEQHYHDKTIRRFYETVQHLDVARWCEHNTIPCTLVGHNQGNGADREQLDLKVIRHACGHTVLHPFYGDDEHSWDERACQLADAPCRVCQADEQARERERQASAARLHAAERGLPPLEGSPKQVAWAETIRLSAFGAADKVLKWIEEVDDKASEEDPDHWHEIKRGVEKAVAYLEEQTEARWWIDHRHGIINSLDGGRALLSSIAQELGFI